MTTAQAKPQESLRELQTLADVAQFLQVSEKYLKFLLFGPTQKRRYTTFTIPKKSGGVREIASPPAAIRSLQTRLKDFFERVYRPKVSVHGFVTERSIVSNASPHVRQRWILNVDLKSFFPTIHFGRLRGMLMSKPYFAGPGAATVIARICCHGDRLPQGACTSPILANMVCARLDGQLLQLARKTDCMYTRYADDLSFSTRAREFPIDLATPTGGWTGTKIQIGVVLKKLIQNNGFELNEEKSRLQFRDLHQDVTGIVVNKIPNVRRTFVRQVRAMIHAWEKFDLPLAEKAFHEKFDRRPRRPGTPKPPFRLVVKGKLDYLRMVRGESDPLYRRLSNKLYRLDPGLVKEWLPIMPAVGAGEQNIWQHWAREYAGSVYLIEVTDAAGKVHGGSAFATRRGFLCTAEHNLIGECFVASPLTSRIPVLEASVHPEAARGFDVAMLKVPIEPKGPFLPVVTTLPEIGEPVAVLGFAGVPRRNPSYGIYSAKVESLNTDYWGNTFIQVSGELAGGMSGGPLINTSGAVVGIVSEQTFEKTKANVRPRPFQQVLPITHLSKVDLQQLVSPIQYAAQRRIPAGGGVRKLLAFIEQIAFPDA